MSQVPQKSEKQVNDEIRERIHVAAQELANIADPGTLVTGWNLVFSVTSAESPERGGFCLESALGQALHVDLGLLEIATLMTRKRAGV